MADHLEVAELAPGSQRYSLSLSFSLSFSRRHTHKHTHTELLPRINCIEECGGEIRPLTLESPPKTDETKGGKCWRKTLDNNLQPDTGHRKSKTKGEPFPNTNSCLVVVVVLMTQTLDWHKERERERERESEIYLYYYYYYYIIIIYFIYLKKNVFASLLQ